MVTQVQFQGSAYGISDYTEAGFSPSTSALPCQFCYCTNASVWCDIRVWRRSAEVHSLAPFFATYDLFNDDVSSSDSIASKNRMNGEQGTGKNMGWKDDGHAILEFI
jgi:hypothetical protein